MTGSDGLAARAPTSRGAKRAGVIHSLYETRLLSTVWSSAGRGLMAGCDARRIPRRF